uniref:peroxidase n=1 Tax=Nicotiana sylvestris TaxID=4096 RepID=A0A1U7W496_NICSY
AHTIGQARCTSFRARIYNETNNLDASFARTRQSNCPRSSGSGDNNLAPLDLQTPNKFDNNYFKNLVDKKGLLHSDQQLFNGGSADSIVTSYSNNPSSFSSDFVTAMIKMGDIRPLTGSNGEIRKNCRSMYVTLSKLKSTTFSRVKDCNQENRMRAIDNVLFNLMNVINDGYDTHDEGITPMASPRR